MQILRDLDIHLKKSHVATEAKIAMLKTELDTLSRKYGITNELTVAKSQELDVILNEYMVMNT